MKIIKVFQKELRRLLRRHNLEAFRLNTTDITENNKPKVYVYLLIGDLPHVRISDYLLLLSEIFNKSGVEYQYLKNVCTFSFNLEDIEALTGFIRLY